MAGGKQSVGYGLLAAILVFWAGGLIFADVSLAADPSAPMEMSLPEAINIALRFNRTVKSAYLDRVVQKFGLKVSEDKFNPNLTLNTGASVTETRTKTEGTPGTSSSSTTGPSATLAMDKLFETGAAFTFAWDRGDTFSDSSSAASNWTGTNTWTATVSQPLLKGFGQGVNTASVTLARIAEQSNLLTLRDTIISTVDSTISAFRAYAKAVRQVEISKASVERSRANLENNRLLVSMGRLAANELIQNESDLANQELSHEGDINSMDRARLSLLAVLDLDQNIRITPVEEINLTPKHPDLATCLAIAFKNRADYINAGLNIQSAQINLTLAQDNMKWDLNATGGYTRTDTNYKASDNTDTGAWNAGLKLSIPLYGDLAREQGLLSAQTSLQKVKLDMDEVKQTITLGAKDAVREVETRLKQVGMAVRARELSEKKLAVEKEKLAVGRSTNFQVVSYQNDLVTSLQGELDAKVAYLDALKNLDTFLATTLLTWKIDYNKEYDQWPGK